MSDETKVWLAVITLAAIFVIGCGFLIHGNNREAAALRQAACVNPDSVACALAVRR